VRDAPAGPSNAALCGGAFGYAQSRSSRWATEWNYLSDPGPASTTQQPLRVLSGGTAARARPAAWVTEARRAAAEQVFLRCSWRTLAVRLVVNLWCLPSGMSVWRNGRRPRRRLARMRPYVQSAPRAAEPGVLAPAPDSILIPDPLGLLLISTGLLGFASAY